jgi:acyl-coenzyme A thioesterase 13
MMLEHATEGSSRMSVSQSLNLSYHAPAPPYAPPFIPNMRYSRADGRGAQLRVVSTSLALSARSMSARSEIWDVTNQCLVASGVHIKMDVSAAKAAKL